jgi:hypothetical protein
MFASYVLDVYGFQRLPFGMRMHKTVYLDLGPGQPFEPWA